jgi:hypothetical protein
LSNIFVDKSEREAQICGTEIELLNGEIEMPIYKLGAQVTVSAYTTIEAPDEATALEIAGIRSVVIGGLNTGEDENENWIVDDADGKAEHIRLDHED